MSQFTNEILGDVSVNNFPASQPVTGPLTDAELRATPVPVSGSVTVSGTVNTVQGGTPTATVSRIAVSPSVVTLQASNSARKRLIVHNESGTLFVKLGLNATDTDYTYRLSPNTALELDYYTGDVTAIKANGSTFAQVTEIA